MKHSPVRHIGEQKTLQSLIEQCMQSDMGVDENSFLQDSAIKSLFSNAVSSELFAHATSQHVNKFFSTATKHTLFTSDHNYEDLKKNGYRDVDLS
jgi:hypothetical protein